jgi:hypothetical protein
MTIMQYGLMTIMQTNDTIQTLMGTNDIMRTTMRTVGYLCARAYGKTLDIMFDNFHLNNLYSGKQRSVNVGPSLGLQGVDEPDGLVDVFRRRLQDFAAVVPDLNVVGEVDDGQEVVGPHLPQDGGHRVLNLDQLLALHAPVFELRCVYACVFEAPASALPPSITKVTLLVVPARTFKLLIIDYI